MDELEAEAKATGSKHVMNLLQRPGQLEKVAQYKNRVTRKKNSVEALLKSAIQNQLDGVREGLNLLAVALDNVKQVQEKEQWMSESLTNIPDIVTRLNDVKETLRQCQYVTSIENLKHIFSVPESVEKTKTWINEGKLLFARQSLADLENSRDDLLFELHKLPQTPTPDVVMFRMHFEEVGRLSDMMEKQIRLILARTLNTVRKDPTVIVTALRIIETEERADTFALQREKLTSFLPPGRPKRWKAMAMSVLEKAVEQRIEGTQTDEREGNKMWLVRHLELTRQLILEDLRVVKTLCAPCFPPCWDIVNCYKNMYHQCLARHLSDVIRGGLIGNEYVSLLSWCLHTYPGPELMSHSELNIEVTTLGPLLETNVIHALQHSYLKHIESNYTEWLKKTLDKEREEWANQMKPEESEVHFQTSAPVIIYQMIDQNLQVAKTISKEFCARALELSMDQMINYSRMYREAIADFKNRHFANRNEVPYYTHHMIAVINNCSKFRELIQPWRSEINKSESFSKFERLLFLYLEVRNEAVRYLLDEAFSDLYALFNDLLTPKWLTSSSIVDTICCTFVDYFQDYFHLTDENFEYVISVSQRKVARCYIYKIMQSKITFRSYEERKEATNKIKDEVYKIKATFVNIAPNVQIDSCFDVLDPLVEIIRIEDPEMLLLDLHELVDRYPDITEQQLTSLLLIRGDLSRAEIRDRITYIQMSRNNQSTYTTSQTSVFSIVNSALSSGIEWYTSWNT